MLFILQGIIQFTLARKVHRNYAKRAQTDESGRYAIEAIENVRTIQLLTCEDMTYSRFDDISKKQLRADLLMAPFNAMNFASSHGLQQFTQECF
jgi:ATP-binding cassette subfamily B (MDR/TAP) protein 1